MSVKDAAQRLGIGRPALLNFLNGKSALSPQMAVRLEKAFAADRKRPLDMQAAYDQHEQSAGTKDLAVRAFVPNFLTFKARQIEGWADGQIDAPTHLPVLLRKLVHSTGHDLRQVDFPGYHNAQCKGSDDQETAHRHQHRPRSRHPLDDKISLDLMIATRIR
jgi:addiction module HigA family antidote